MLVVLSLTVALLMAVLVWERLQRRDVERLLAQARHEVAVGRTSTVRERELVDQVIRAQALRRQALAERDAARGDLEAMRESLAGRYRAVKNDRGVA